MGRSDPATLAALVQRAKQQDQDAWTELVDRLGAPVWAVTRSFSLSPEDAIDVAQTVWLRLAEHIDRLREPERVDAWLITTARFECLRLKRSATRTRPIGGSAEFDLRGDMAGGDTPEALYLRNERDIEIWCAVDALDEPCRTLVKLCLVDPPLSYEDLGAALDVPSGTIGPRRRRCLRRMEKQLRERLLRDEPHA